MTEKEYSQLQIGDLVRIVAGRYKGYYGKILDFNIWRKQGITQIDWGKERAHVLIELPDGVKKGYQYQSLTDARRPLFVKIPLGDACMIVDILREANVGHELAFRLEELCRAKIPIAITPK